MTAAIRPGRADMTTTRVERNTASGMLWVTNTMVVPVRRQMRISSAFIRSRVISSSAPNGSSISSSFGSNDERPGDRDPLLHAARQLPRMPLGEALELDQLQEVGGATSALLGREAHDLERQLDVLGDRPPVHQDRRLEDHPVVAVEARLARPACR